MELRLESLTSPDVAEAIDKGLDTAVWPMGAVEQHGRHCPLGTDSLIARGVARQVAQCLGALCLPPLWFGVSSHHMEFAGSLTLRPEILCDVIEDILESLIRHGIKKVLVLNGHGGNTPAIQTACAKVRQRWPQVFLAQSSLWLALHDIYTELPADLRQDSWRTLVAHGGFLETSLVMALHADLVHLDRTVPVPMDRFVRAADPALSVTLKFNELTPVGSGGDATAANAEAGRLFLEKTVQRIAVKFKSAVAEFGMPPCAQAG